MTSAMTAASSRGPGLSMRVIPATAALMSLALRLGASKPAGVRAALISRAGAEGPDGAPGAFQGLTSPRSTPRRVSNCAMPNCGWPYWGWGASSAAQASGATSRSRPGSTTAPCGNPAITASRSAVAGIEPVDPAAMTGSAGGFFVHARVWASHSRLRRSAASSAPSAASTAGHCSVSTCKNSSVCRQCSAKASGTSPCSPSNVSRSVWT